MLGRWKRPPITSHWCADLRRKNSFTRRLIGPEIVRAAIDGDIRMLRAGRVPSLKPPAWCIGDCQAGPFDSVTSIGVGLSTRSRRGPLGPRPLDAMRRPKVRDVMSIIPISYDATPWPSANSAQPIRISDLQTSLEIP